MADRILPVLLNLVRAKGVSLWYLDEGDELRCRIVVGDPGTESLTRPAATELLAGGAAELYRGEDTFGIRVPGRTEALVAFGSGLRRPQQQMLLELGAQALGTGAAGGDPGSQPEVAIRQLSRLRFDLHDGPQQDVILLAEDLRMFQGQLEKVLEGNPLQSRLVGRVEDLQARLVALDGDLRRISALLESPFLQERSFPRALEQLTQAFAERTSILPQTDLKGDFDSLTDSQQITLLALITEALNNIREHTDAGGVTIGVSAEQGTLEATICDDGQGFDPEKELIRAARDGHLGLVGMHERVQMLGGYTNIESRPGGPTVISVRIPRYQESPDAAPEEEATG